MPQGERGPRRDPARGAGGVGTPGRPGRSGRIAGAPGDLTGAGPGPGTPRTDGDERLRLLSRGGDPDGRRSGGRAPLRAGRAQLCGDAHLSNFGLFAAPDRSLVFDVNDFDETNPGPFEWDVKRLATSFVLAARDNGLPGKVRPGRGRSGGRRVPDRPWPTSPARANWTSGTTGSTSAAWSPPSGRPRRQDEGPDQEGAEAGGEGRGDRQGGGGQGTAPRRLVGHREDHRSRRRPAPVP